MKYAWLVVALYLSGCGDDEVGVLYVGIALTAEHDLELPAELDALDANAIGESTGRVDAFPGDGMLNVDVIGLPPLPVNYSYLPLFAFTDDPRDVLEAESEATAGHDDHAWDLVGPVLEADEDGGMASMLMLGAGDATDLGALRCAAVQIVGSPELEPPMEEVVVLAGEFAFDESGGVEAGGAEPAGHSHGP